MPSTENYRNGHEGELFFSSMMSSKGIFHEFDDNDYYDFRIGKGYKDAEIKVEVKSTGLLIKDGQFKEGESVYSHGRFILKPGQIEHEYDDKDWFCFLVRWKGKFILLGFMQAKNVPKRRHLSMTKLQNIGLLNLEDWMDKVL